MELIVFLRLLWRCRLPVAVGALVALGVAVALGGSPVASSGLAVTGVLVDTPRSALIANAPSGSNSLAWRATLLAMLLGTDRSRAEIAGAAGVPSDRIAVIDSELTSAVNAADLPAAAIGVANATTEPYVLTVGTDDVLPVVDVRATAPSRAGAVRVVQAAVQTLQAGASPRDTAELQGLRITEVHPVSSIEIPGGPGRKTMILTAIAVFALWIVGVAVWATRRRGRGRSVTVRAPAPPAWLRRRAARTAAGR